MQDLESHSGDSTSHQNCKNKPDYLSELFLSQQQYSFIPSKGNLSLKRRGKNVTTEPTSSTRKYHITKTWVSGEKVGTNGLRFKGSVTMIIPKTLCDKYGFSAPSNVVISDNGDGILVKPVMFNEDE